MSCDGFGWICSLISVVLIHSKCVIVSLSIETYLISPQLTDCF